MCRDTRKGTRAIYEGAVNADRYLLTFVNANHNAAAPIPAPAETYAYSEAQRGYPFTHYADAVWDTARMNNIFNHFATAFFGLHLKGEAGQAGLPGSSCRTARTRCMPIDRDGKPTAGAHLLEGLQARHRGRPDARTRGAARSSDVHRPLRARVRRQEGGADRCRSARCFSRASSPTCCGRRSLMLGVEIVEIDPGNTLVTPLNFVSYPYSHSLVTLVGWSALFALAYRAIRGWHPVAIATVAALVFSHYVLDVITHRPDLPITLSGSRRLGLGLWNYPGTDARRSSRAVHHRHDAST